MEQGEKLIDIFKNNDSFSGASESIVNELIEGLESHQVSKGTNLITVGEPGEFVWVLIKGELEVLSSAGEEINQISLPGEVFGEISAVSQSNATATVRSLSDVEVLAIPHQRLHEVMKKSPILASSVLRSMAKYLGKR